MTILWFEQALTQSGWQHGVSIHIDSEGCIAAVSANTKPTGERYGIALPSPANLHSHAFQRAMAGMTESRGPDPSDNFWTWRKLMYRFLDQLTPDDVEAIAAYVQMEMLEAGYSSVGEFHYLHHQPNGEPYTAIDEMSERIFAAVSDTQIGLTLLPVLYEHGGCDGRSLGPGQQRFGNSPERFEKLYSKLITRETLGTRDTNVGVAPHSLRAVSKQGLNLACELAMSNPLHIHVAEQIAEVKEIEQAWGARPVEWLLDNHNVDQHWCLIHATQMLPVETQSLARTGAVVGLCPITESNLGDGIFDARRYRESGGKFGIGSDSNVRISLSEELRTLEYSQRLRDRARAVLAEPPKSTGRVLLEQAAMGGAQALQRNSGTIESGKLADIIALDGSSPNLLAVDDDAILDAWIFSGNDQMITDVWSAGRHLVRESIHINHSAISQRYSTTMKALATRL